MKKLPPSSLILFGMVALGTPVSAATISNNQTGFSATNIYILDNAFTSSTSLGVNSLGGTVSGTFAVDASESGLSGNEGIDYYNTNGRWTQGGAFSYEFSGLLAGTYVLYGNWTGNGSVGGVYTANGTQVGISNQNVASAVGTDGFSANAGTGTGYTVNFQRIGTYTLAADGSVDLVVTKDPTKTYLRYDALALAIPEPSAALLGSLGALAVLRRRRA